MKSKSSSDDRLYFVCHDCKQIFGLSRIWHYSSGRFYPDAVTALVEHATHEHEFCYEHNLFSFHGYKLVGSDMKIPEPDDHPEEI